PHEAGLDLVGDEQRADLLAHGLDRFEVTVPRHGEAVGRGDAFDDHASRVALHDLAFHGVEIVEGHLGHLVGIRFGEEEFREAVVPDFYGETGVAVIAALQTDDAPAFGGVARALQRDVDRLATARAVHRV